MRPLALFVWLLMASTAVAAQPRVALVIGNEAYGGPVWSTLQSPHEDAAAIADRLSSPALGFDEVLRVQDADYPGMLQALARFKAALSARPGALAFFYYSGHGTYAQGLDDARPRNYLVPSRTDLSTETEASFKAVAVERVVQMLTAAEVGAGVVVIDACRDNGLAGKKGSKGLGEMERTENYVVAFAAAEGRTAIDGGPGSLSPYAQALSRRLAEPGLSVADLFIQVRKDVMTATGNRQQPAQHNALNENFALVTGAASVGGPGDTDAQRLAAALAAARAEAEAAKREAAAAREAAESARQAAHQAARPMPQAVASASAKPSAPAVPTDVQILARIAASGLRPPPIHNDMTKADQVTAGLAALSREDAAVPPGATGAANSHADTSEEFDSRILGRWQTQFECPPRTITSSRGREIDFKGYRETWTIAIDPLYESMMKATIDVHNNLGAYVQDCGAFVSRRPDGESFDLSTAGYGRDGLHFVCRNKMGSEIGYGGQMKLLGGDSLRFDLRSVVKPCLDQKIDNFVMSRY